MANTHRMDKNRFICLLIFLLPFNGIPFPWNAHIFAGTKPALKKCFYLLYTNVFHMTNRRAAALDFPSSAYPEAFGLPEQRCS